MKVDIEQFLDSMEYRKNYFSDKFRDYLKIGCDYYSIDYCFKNLESTWEIHKLSPEGRETECVFSSRNRLVAWREFMRLYSKGLSEIVLPLKF